MEKVFHTQCDNCGKSIKVSRHEQEGQRFYIVEGLFCINVPGFFCNRDCFDETVTKIKRFDYLDEDDDGRAVLDVEVMINESHLLDKMYDIVYDAERNPLFPTLILQRLLAVDPENERFLYGLSSLYVGLLAAKTTPQQWRPKLLERLNEVEADLKEISEAGYKRLRRLREHYNV